MDMQMDGSTVDRRCKSMLGYNSGGCAIAIALGIGRSCLKPGGGDLSHADT